MVQQQIAVYDVLSDIKKKDPSEWVLSGMDGGVIPIIFYTKVIKIHYIWYYYFILSNIKV